MRTHAKPAKTPGPLFARRHPLAAARSFFHFAALVRDPTRLDKVIALADTNVAADVKREMVAALRTEPECAAAFRDRPRRGPVDVAALARRPAGTLGRV